MKHRRFLVGLLLLMLLLGMLAVPAFAQGTQSPAEVPAAMLKAPQGAPSGYVPGSHTGAELTWEPYVEDLKRSPTTYTDFDDAVSYLQGRAIYRRDNVDVDIKLPYSSQITEAYLEELWYAILDGALAHDPANPDGGDYLLAHIESVDGSISAKGSGSYVLVEFTYSFQYLSTWAQETSVTSAVNRAISNLKLSGKTEHEKITAIYDFITEKVKYDYEGLENAEDIKKFTAYGAIVEESAVCQGYASLFYRMCLEASVDARLITGIGTDGVNAIAHGWNIVRIDGRYYNVDPTWDAELRQAGYEYAFFLRCDENFVGHIRDEYYLTDEFCKAFPMSDLDYIPGVLRAGYCGEKVVYFLYPDYTLEIVGEGPMYAYRAATSTGIDYCAPWYDYREKIETVTICSGVTSIGNYGFNNCTNLKNIEIPDTVTVIGSNAFAECDSLTSFTIPKAVTVVSSYMFSGCANLETVVLHDEVTAIHDSAFQATGLQEISFPESVTYLGHRAFESCRKLKELVIPASVRDFGFDTFRNCLGLESVVIEGDYEAMDFEQTFESCKNLKTVTFLGTVKELDRTMFGYCYNLETVILPEGLELIGYNLFRCCESLKEITIPDTVRAFGVDAFFSCTSLEKINLPKDLQSLESGALSSCTSLKEIKFLGGAPSFARGTFSNTTLTAYYPSGDATWTEEVRQNYGGTITWVPYENAAASCEHANTELRKQKDADCDDDGYTGDTYCSDCGTCIALGQVIPQLGHDMEKVIEPGTCQKMELTYERCKVCDDERNFKYTTFGDHVYENGVCTVCGVVDESFDKKFALYGANMTLGNKLDMNFFVNRADLTGEGYYAIITKSYADGSKKEVRVDQADWKDLGSLCYFTFTGVKAKEMSDRIEVVIYNKAGEPVSESYTDSVQEYSRRMLSKDGTADKDKSLYVEMLNYGAAAQTEFGYDTGNLASSVITAQEQAAYGMPDRAYADQSQRDAVCKGVNLTLENQILFNVFFDGSYVTEDSYVVVNYVNHNGNPMEEKVTDFETLGDFRYASFKSLVVADCSIPVTVKLYDGQGNVVSTVVDSVESYAARMSAKSPLYAAIMKFADAAYQYFHGCNHSWSDWKTIREATLTEPGEQQRHCSQCDAVQSREVPVLEIMTQAQAQEARENGTLASNPLTGYEYSQVTGNWYSSNYPNYKDFNADGTIKVAYVCKFDGGWFTPKANALAEELGKAGYEFLFIDANADGEAWMNGIENVIKQDFDAVVLTPVNSQQLPEAIAMLREAGIAYMTTDDGGKDSYGFHAPHYGLDDYSLHYQLGQYVGQKIQKESWLADVDGDWSNFRMVMLDSPAVQAIHLRNMGFLDGINSVVKIPEDKVLWIDCGGCFTNEVYEAAKKVVDANQNAVDKWLFSSGGATAIVAVMTVIEEYGIDPDNVKVADTISTTEPLEVMGNSNFAGSLYGSCLISKFSGQEIGKCMIDLIEKGTPLPGFTNYPFLVADETNYSQRLAEMNGN